MKFAGAVELPLNASPHTVSISKTEMPADAYSEKESSLGFGRDDGASLAGKESAIVLSSIFSRFAFELAGSTTLSSGSLPGLIFAVRFLGVAFLRTIVSYSCFGASTNHRDWKPTRSLR